MEQQVARRLSYAGGRRFEPGRRNMTKPAIIALAAAAIIGVAHGALAAVWDLVADQDTGPIAPRGARLP